MNTDLPIVLASGNPGKIDEINAMIHDMPYRVIAQSELGIGEAVEDKPTFIENALIKARHASTASGQAAVADDSGLIVDALNGEPGVKSARYSGADANDERNIAKLLDQLASVPNAQRTCHFVCTIVFLRHGEDPSPIIATGSLHGTVHHRKQGSNGFGYDPVVWIPQLQRTLAELDPVTKNAISHRGKALRKLKDRLLTVADIHDA